MDYSAVEKHLELLLSRYENRKCKVYLLHGDLTPGQMTWLYTRPKISALVNISHGEGFGLPMFEAAREALPVITVGWSGQLDFLHHNGKNYFQSVQKNSYCHYLWQYFIVHYFSIMNITILAIK